MSMADRTKFQYWVKSSLSLRYVKDGLVNIANESADSLKNNIKKDVEATCKAAVQSVCTKCTWNSVKKTKKGNICPYYMSCNMCNHWLNNILKHAMPNHKLEWSNCDPKKWPTRGWEIIKVFMGYGCDNSRNAEDIDCSNLMTMMLGCTYFHQMISRLPILQEIKDIRNTVMHSGSLELSEGEMKTNLNKMIELLEDPVCFKQDSTCQEAVDKIKKLRDDTLTVTLSKEEEYAEINGMIGELRKKITDLNKKKDLISTNVQHISDEQESFSNSHQELKDELKDSMTRIQRKQEQCQTLLDTLKTYEMPDIRSQLQTMIGQLLSIREDTYHDIQRLQDKFEAMDLKQIQLEQRQDRAEKQMSSFQQGQDRAEKQMTSFQQRQDRAETSFQLRQDMTEIKITKVTHEVEILKLNQQDNGCPQNDEERKKKLQRHLIELYENDHSSMSVYPLKPHLTRKLDEMYVTPEMVEKNPRGQTKPQPDLADRLEHTKGQSNRKIGTLKDVFFNDGNLCKNIYVTGEAGIGKSTFCKYIVRMWLKAHSNQTEDTSSDSEVLKQFPLLFYVQLRGVKLGTETGKLANLIKKQLNLNDGLENFFSEDNSLIILDSLDEIASGLPFRGVLDKSTRLTTSRPWKLEASRENIYGNKIDRQIEIVCIGETSAETLVKNLLPVLAEESTNDESTNVSKRDSQSFITEMKNKNLVSFLRIPVLLIQVLCLWYDDNLAEDESQSSIYKKLLCYQIKLSKISRKISQDKYKFLRCKSLKCPCNNFSDIVVKLGKLAFNALVSENRENELIFDHNITEMHGLSKEDIDICLKIGCLSKHKLFGKITDDPKMYVSFVHKTNQEYFASIYLAYKVSKIKSVLKSAIGNLDKMLELEKVLMFVSGLHPEKGKTMATLLLEAAKADPSVLEYRQTAGWSRHNDLISNVQNAILAAMEECWRSNKRQLNLPLMDIVIDEENMSSVSFSVVSLGSPIASIRIKGDIPAGHLFTLFNTSLLQKVALSDCTISGATVTQFISRSLCALDLSFVRINHADLSGLCSQLAAAENLREVRLWGLECETHGKLWVGRCVGLSLDLGGLTKLRKLDIWFCGDVSALVLSPHMSHLQQVYLYFVTTTAAIVRKLVDSLPRNNVQVRLSYVTIRHEVDAPSPDAILDNIRRSCTVEDDLGVERKENGDLFVKSFVFRYKQDGEFRVRRNLCKIV